MFATGIENSIPTINNGKTRVDQMEASDHYKRWKEDFDCVEEIGIQYLRWGPPLHRTYLGPGKYDWEYADMALADLRRRLITPIVDLCHFGVPDWIGNFQNPDFSQQFANYAAAFAERYRFNPTQLRRGSSASKAQGAMALRLAYRPPYDVEAMLRFCAKAQIHGVEHVEGLTLRRSVGWQHRGQRLTGWVSSTFVPDRHEVHVSASPSLSPVLGALMQGVRHSLDLDADPALIDPVLALLPVPLRPGTRLPGVMDGFEGALRVILGQQVTVKAARTLVQRVVDRYGQAIDTPASGPVSRLQFTRTVWYAPKLGVPVVIEIEDNDEAGKPLRRERVELMHAQQARTAN